MHTHHTRQWISAFILCVWSTAAMARQDANNYLDILREEAEKGGATAEIVETRPKLKINANSTPAQLATSPQIFEDVLQSRLTATYAIYMKLPKREKLRVYYAYRKSGNFSEVRSLVLKGFKNRR